MTLYRLAVRHAQLMAFALMAMIFFVITFERVFGVTWPAFAIAIVVLVFANGRMLQYNCPRCGKNLFFRGKIAVPWPTKTCGSCGLDLDHRPEG
ncbi:MAG: hypothetical protein AAGK02_08470 [Pseudomonadota bacterium]